MDKHFQEIGYRIKLIRKEKRLTQEQLAEKAGISTSYIYKIEAGDDHVTVRTLLRIAEALQVQAAQLFIAEQDDSDIELRLKALLVGNTESELEFICFMLGQFRLGKEIYLKEI